MKHETAKAVLNAVIQGANTMDDIAEAVAVSRWQVGNIVWELEGAGLVEVDRMVLEDGKHRISSTLAPDADSQLAELVRELAGAEAPEWQAESWLRTRYQDYGLTLEEMADEAGVSPMTIRNHMERHGIPRRRPGHGGPGRVVCCELNNGFRSTWEHEVAHRLEEMSADWTYEPGFMETPHGGYLPDFVVEGAILEVKGRVDYGDGPAQAERLSHLLEAGRTVVVVGAGEARPRGARRRRCRSGSCHT